MYDQKSQKKYYNNHRKKVIEKSKRWNRTHSKLHKERALEWNKKNPEKFKKNKLKYRLANVEKHREWNKNWREKHKEELKIKAKQYKSQPEVKRHYKEYMQKYHLSRREKIVGSPKPDICPVCRRNKGRICVDHCHKTNKIRGWLCDGCNVALGRVDDRIDILQNLINYLKKHI